MQNPDLKNDYDAIVKTLMDMFGEMLPKDVIYSIVENFGGDLHNSANAIMVMTMDENIGKIEELKPNESNTIISNVDSNSFDSNLSAVKSENQPIQFSYSSPKLETVETSANNGLVSYARAIHTGAIPKQITSPSRIVSNDFLTPAAMQFKQIITYHNEGTRTLILLRGAPGSGKSYLAQNIINAIYNNFEEHNYKCHIFCADNFFMRNNVYCYEKSELHNAHAYNQTLARHAIVAGVSPVIIDNTHTEIWEMEPYVKFGVENGYVVEVMEPNTPWAKKKNELLKKNIHGVPFFSIKRMLDRYEGGVNGTDLILRFRCNYSIDMRPPVRRTYPPFLCNGLEISNKIHYLDNSESIKEETQPKHCSNSQNIHLPIVNDGCKTMIAPKTSLSTSIDETMSQDLSTDDCYKQVQKRIEEVKNVENEWENGEHWEDRCNKTCKTELNEMNSDSKPQRLKKQMRPSTSNNSTSSVKQDQDRFKLSLFMPPWSEYENSTLADEQPHLEHIKKVSSYTCVESGDTDICGNKNPLKIISGTPRDINEYHVESGHIKIPDKWMLDKGTTTNDNTHIICKCPQEEQHFAVFSKLFNSIPIENLRDIFDKCYGDINWAVDLVLESMPHISCNITDKNDLFDSDTDKNDELCKCLAAYHIIPNQNILISTLTNEVKQSPNQLVKLPQLQVKKGKKVISEESFQLKRQIEQNIVISDNHYSQHCQKIRKMRRGEFDTKETLNPMSIISKDVFSGEICGDDSNTCEKENDSNACGEDTVSIELHKEFIEQLDKIFGRKDMTYSENMNTKIEVPMSILNQINALWTQSLAFQLEENSNQKQIMIQQDEEFARQLAMKEAELLEAGKEPEVPNFKEIMDMDFALALYQKDVAEWRNNEPNDLAAKMSREKLHNLFPDISPDTLSELLMAHDNNFQSTVEVLLMSTGKVEILEMKNGVNKFVMKKEMERQEKLLEIERKAISEVEWPLLNRDVNVDMTVVEGYRKQANDHLQFRYNHYQKSQDFMRRGMTTVASFYSDVAAYHKLKFEQANSLAAATLMQVHAKNCSNNATIDLHYLRVGEAKESLDLFLDTHIQKLKEMRVKNGTSFHHTLYFITGRGLHSNGKPRIKPAVIKRLLDRGLAYTECNPGLLSAKVCANNLLSYEL